MDLILHWNQEVIKRGSVELKFVPTKWQLADALTKAIGPEKFEETLKAWKLISVPSGSVKMFDKNGSQIQRKPIGATC